MYREIIVKCVICSLHLFKTNSVCGVSFSMFYRLHDTGDAIGMAVVVSCKNQNSVIGVNFSETLIKGNEI